MNVNAKAIAEHLQGSVDGNPQCQVSTLSKIEDATPGSVTFIANPKYASYIETTQASIIIVGQDFICDEKPKATLIRVANPYEAFSRLLFLFEEKKEQQKGLHPSATIHPEASLGDNIYVGPHVVIEAGVKIEKGVIINANAYVGNHVTLGANTIIHPNVVLYADTQIGSQCIIHSGTVIGADGFGFAPQKDGHYQKIPQTGNVVIGNNVEIGANTTIDRATIGSTQIEDGVKLDNQVQIAHNAHIGKHTVIAAQSGVAGSSKVGDYCVVGGQVGIVGHLKIGNHVRIQGQSGVIKNVPDRTDIQGTPAMNYRDFYRSYAVFKRLPQLDLDLNQIKNKNRD